MTNSVHQISQVSRLATGLRAVEFSPLRGYCTQNSRQLN